MSTETDANYSIFDTFDAYLRCEDQHELCTSNLAQSLILHESDPKKLLKDIYFTIGNDSGADIEAGVIPMNYFCSWSIKLDPKQAYTVTITRSLSPTILEDLNLFIEGRKQQRLFSNRDLLQNN